MRLTREELLKVRGIMLFSGYNKVPSFKLYWSSKSDIGNELVVFFILRDRFIQILHYLHFASTFDLNHEV